MLGSVAGPSLHWASMPIFNSVEHIIMCSRPSLYNEKIFLLLIIRKPNNFQKHLGSSEILREDTLDKCVRLHPTLSNKKLAGLNDYTKLAILIFFFFKQSTIKKINLMFVLMLQIVNFSILLIIESHLLITLSEEYILHKLTQKMIYLWPSGVYNLYKINIPNQINNDQISK